MSCFIRFLKDWTLPVAIAVGTICYLTFYYVSALDELGDILRPVFDVIFPLFVFLTLFVTFCKVDFHDMHPHRWHVGILVAQLLLVALNIGIILWAKSTLIEVKATSMMAMFASPLLWEAMLTCIIGPAASAAPVVVGKLGGNISTMTTYVLISSLVSALLIPLVFPMLEQTVHVSFIDAFLIILEKVSIVLLLPLTLCEGTLCLDCRTAQSEFLLLGHLAEYHYGHYGKEYCEQQCLADVITADSSLYLRLVLRTVWHWSSGRAPVG